MDGKDYSWEDNPEQWYTHYGIQRPGYVLEISHIINEKHMKSMKYIHNFFMSPKIRGTWVYYTRLRNKMEDDHIKKSIRKIFYNILYDNKGVLVDNISYDPLNEKCKYLLFTNIFKISRF